MNKLLEKAKEAQDKRTKLPITKDEIEMALAVIKGDIPVLAYGKALGIKGNTHPSYRIVMALKEGYKRGILIDLEKSS